MSNEIINLVCSHSYNKLLKSMDSYKVDLGKSYTKRDSNTNNLEPNIKDIFVLDFFKDEGILIYKVGVMGIISIYTYSNLQPNEIIIYKGNEKYYRSIDINESEINIEKSLAELIMNLEIKLD